MTDQKPYLSPSRLETYCRCPEQYRRRYVENERMPPGIAQMKGSALHSAAKTNFRQKIESREDLSAKEIQALAAADLETALQADYALSEQEVSQGAGIVLAEALDQTMAYAAAFARQQAPDYQPIFVEQQVRIALPAASHDLLGVIDLGDDQGRVTDFKTGKRKSQADANSSVQLTVYAAAFHARTGTPAKEVRLDTLTQLKSGVSRQVHRSTRGAADYRALANRINAVLAGIAAGSFPPTTPTAWWCDERYCGYARTCPFYEQKKRAGL